MADHYNLYYILLEDKAQNPMPEQRARKIRKNIEKFYKKIKPPWKLDAPKNRDGG